MCICYKKPIITTIILILFFLCFGFKRHVARYKNHLGFKSKIDESQNPFEIIDVYNPDPTSNVIVCSLYGNHPKYYKHLDSIQKTIKKIPNWQLRIYLHEKVHITIRQKIINKKIQVFLVRDPLVKPGNSSGAFWRFMPLNENIRFIVADIDEEYNLEMLKKFITLWEKSKAPFMRVVLPNFYLKKSHIIACCWGGIGCRSMGLGKDLRNYKQRSIFGSDEIYLNNILYPIASKKGLINFHTHFSSLFTHLVSYPFVEPKTVQNKIISYTKVAFFD